MLQSSRPSPGNTGEGTETPRIDPEFLALVRPLTEKERAELEASILAEGVRDPIVVWRGLVVDGHNRLAIASGQNADGEVLPYETVERDFADRDAAKLWIIGNQLGRRNLHDYDRNLLAEKRRAIIEAAQPKGGRPAAGGFGEEGEPALASAPVFGKDARSTDGRLAEIADTSRDSVRKHRLIAEYGDERIADGLREGLFSTENAYYLARVGRECGTETYDALWQHADEDARVRFSTPQLRHLLGLAESGNGDEVTADLVQIVESGQESPKTGKPTASVFEAHALRQWERNQAEATAKRDARRALLRASPLPDKKYEVIVADPAWPYEHDITPSRAIENHYDTMPVEQIMALEVPADERAMLFLWCPVSLLESGLAVVRAWGFSYRSAIVWDKENLGMGTYVRQQCEMLLIGRKGEYPTPPRGSQPRSLLRVKPGRHSEKPEEVYEHIERMYPGAVKVELFARRSREGWDGWGDEYPGQGPVALHASPEGEEAAS